MKKANKNLSYYLSILLSAAGIAIIAIGFLLLVTDTDNVTEALKSGNVLTNPEIIISLVLIAIGIISYKPLEIWRQRLREEVEYDENGVSKKYGSFMKLSAEERKQIEKQKLADNERILDTPTLKKITHPGEENPNKAMNTLIGMYNVKKEMHQMAARMQYEMDEYERQGKKLKKGETIKHSSMHMCFFGPPGTGKTTCARIMAGYLYKYHYIRKNQCIEVDGNFFRGLTAGESSKKASMLIVKAIGGVLFIDEAYAMLNGSEGQEVIATIVKEMEDRRDDLVIILAGYDNEMRQLINSNPGLESRIKYKLWFGNYDINDLSEIFRMMAGQQNFAVSADMDEAFRDRIEKEQKKRNFGNARTVRTLLEKMIDQHATNLIDGVLDEDDRYILKACDMPSAEEF